MRAHGEAAEERTLVVQPPPNADQADYDLFKLNSQTDDILCNYPLAVPFQANDS